VGARWRGRRAGTLGLAAAFSFYPTKNLSAYGDAGLVTTCDPELAEHMRRLRNHGSSRRYLHEALGWNCRMDAIQATVLRVKLPHLENWNQQRHERAATYDRLFAEAGLVSGVPNPQSANRSLISEAHSPVRLPHRSPHAYHVFHQYVIRAQ